MKADLDSVSPAVGISLFRPQLEIRNKSVRGKEAVQGKSSECLQAASAPHGLHNAVSPNGTPVR